jgi:hypothetical protein
VEVQEPPASGHDRHLAVRGIVHELGNFVR